MDEHIITQVKKLLKNDDGHGFDHILRVRKLALSFAEQEGADKNVVEIACLLHDVDDYKIFGEESANKSVNASRILDESNVSSDIKDHVINIIKTMGYSKYLEGIRPITLEGKMVSDADMCDAIGSQGILRTHAYNNSKGNIFFDKSISPEIVEKSAEVYRNSKTSHAVQHFFDKLLIISPILMTSAGQKEGSKRQEVMVRFLRELFREEGAEDWIKYLDMFIEKNNSIGQLKL